MHQVARARGRHARGQRTHAGVTDEASERIATPLVTGWRAAPQLLSTLSSDKHLVQTCKHHVIG